MVRFMTLSVVQSITYRLMSSHDLGRTRSSSNRGTFRGLPRETKRKTRRLCFWQLVIVVGLFQPCTSTEAEIIKFLDNHSPL